MQLFAYQDTFVSEMFGFVTSCFVGHYLEPNFTRAQAPGYERHRHANFAKGLFILCNQIVFPLRNPDLKVLTLPVCAVSDMDHGVTCLVIRTQLYKAVLLVNQVILAS